MKAPKFLLVGALMVPEFGYLNLPRVVVTAVTKEMCSCLYVSKRSRAQCREYASQSPDIAALAVDEEQKAVHGNLLVTVRGHGLYPVTARYRGPRLGCAIDP